MSDMKAVERVRSEYLRAEGEYWSFNVDDVGEVLSLVEEQQKEIKALCDSVMIQTRKVERYEKALEKIQMSNITDVLEYAEMAIETANQALKE